MRWKTAIYTLLALVIAVFSIGLILAQSGEGSDSGTVVIDVDEAAEGVINVAETTTEGLSAMLSDFINRLNTTPNSGIVQVLMVIGGVILLVAGWRVYDWIIVLAGAFIGGTAAMAAIGSANVVLTIAAFLVGALIGAALAVFLYHVAIFLIGGYVGIVFLSVIASALGWTIPTWALIVALIIGGIVMLGISFEFLVVLASIVGAQLIVTALGLSPQGTWILILTLLGIFIQVFLTHRSGFSIRRRPSRRLLRR